MEVNFASPRLARTCASMATMRRRWGQEGARKVKLRLDQMVAADTLAELMTLPQARCHQLKADRHEQFSLDLDGPHRLIVVVDEEPVPRLADGGIDLAQVERVLVLEIVDTH